MNKHIVCFFRRSLWLLIVPWGSAQGQSVAPLADTGAPPVVVAAPVVMVAVPAPQPPPPPRFRTFTDYATTPGQQAVAGRLDTLAKNPGADLAGVLDILSHLPATQVGAALEQLSPTFYAADSAAAASAAQRHVGLVASYLDDGVPDETKPFSLWTAGLNGSGDGPQAQSSTRTAGGAGGGDYRLGRNLRFGFAFGYTHSDTTQPGSGSRSQMDAFNYGSYATWKFAHGYIEAIFNLAEESYSDQREIAFGSLERLALSQHDGRGGSGYLGGGYDLTLAGIRLRPNAALEYGRFHQAAFTESGAGSLNMVLDDRTDTSLQSRIGLRADYAIKLPFVQLTPRATATWGHDFNTDPSTLQANFAQGGTAPFTLQGPPGTADGLETSAGFSAAFFGVNLFADYVLTFAGSSGLGHSMQAGLWTRF